MLFSELFEDLNHSNRLLFHATGTRAASLILASGIIEAKTDDKAYGTAPGNGVSLTRSYEYALKHKGSFRPKVVFVLDNLNTKPVDYWANKPDVRRTEAEEWYSGPINLRNHLVSINSPTMSLAEFVGQVGRNLNGLSKEEEHMLYGKYFPAVKQWHKKGYKLDFPLWNRWQPVRGFR